jgi:hypothetical protein
MSEEIAALLREIAGNQREALQLQREHMRMYTEQLGRVERINDRAEALQVRAGRSAKLVLWIALPVLMFLLVAGLWPYVRYFLQAFA